MKKYFNSTRTTTIIFCLISLISLEACGPLIVASAAGTVAVIADRRTTGTIIEDNSIELKAMKNIKSVPELRENSNISVTSYNERVLLTGQATNNSIRNQVVEVIRNIPKVRTIYNEITVDDANTLSESTYDTWLTTKIKAKLTGTSKVNPLNIKVTTDDKTVYLMGLVSQEEAKVATEIARKVDGVNKVVKLFEYIDDNQSTFAMN